MKFTVVTLFPGLIEGFLREGLVAQARERGRIEIETLNPRDFTTDAHRTVDDRAFGGGDGMVMKPEPLARAVDALRTQGPLKVVVLSPTGRTWSQKDAQIYAGAGGHIALICGRYAGIDQRFIESYADEEISIGDFILNGGEIAALAVVESVARLRLGVLGNCLSALNDSFSDGLLEAPQFTRPRDWDGWPVPEPLLSGNHAQITDFLRAASLIATAQRRPDLLTGETERELVNARKILSALTPAELKSLGFNDKS